MRAAGAALQIVVLALVVAAAALALGELGMRWDDWVVLAVVSLGVVGVAGPEPLPRGVPVAVAQAPLRTQLGPRRPGGRTG